MTILVLIDLTVHDVPAMSEYETLVTPIMASYGGKPIAKQQQPEVYEGAWSPTWMVVLEFPTRDAVRAFYDAPEYQPLKAMRNAAATSNGLIVL
jgi:uncharacterized protein (DUF1330 family)